jgi:hypothetical protein
LASTSFPSRAASTTPEKPAFARSVSQASAFFPASPTTVSVRPSGGRAGARRFPSSASVKGGGAAAPRSSRPVSRIRIVVLQEERVGPVLRGDREGIVKTSAYNARTGVGMRKNGIPLGLLLFGLLFVVSGLRLARAGVPSLLSAAFAVFSIAIGVALWRRDRWALQGYAVWVVVLLAVGGWRELTVAQEPVAVVALWLLLMATLYGAVGLYLRGALRGERTEEPTLRLG